MPLPVPTVAEMAEEETKSRGLFKILLVVIAILFSWLHVFFFRFVELLSSSIYRFLNAIGTAQKHTYAFLCDCSVPRCLLLDMSLRSRTSPAIPRRLAYF